MKLTVVKTETNLNEELDTNACHCNTGCHLFRDTVDDCKFFQNHKTKYISIDDSSFTYFCGVKEVSYVFVNHYFVIYYYYSLRFLYLNILSDFFLFSHQLSFFTYS
ncbi:unnamed protein product [Nezara viridula]|uniref:Uncharacterized protein n=1 Tax=Nezara viridula TaxID=85310 RepID=A0A9P0HDA7_NEZVI|nr:unnamed protein product [Nezara viridula]